MPAGWRSTVSTFDPDTGILRIGWVTPSGHYAEYAAATRPATTFVGDLTDQAPSTGTIDIAATRWQTYRQSGGYSLVRSFGPVPVVLGTLRDTASLDELRVLASRIGP
jgi:hypothetical protein